MQKAKTAEFEVFDASNWKIGIVLSQFNYHITEELYKSALITANKYKISGANTNTVRVAGAAEIPLALKMMAETGRYNVLLAIGCIIRGETPHFDYVCKIATEGILQVELENKIPIGFGILTTENEEQAVARTNLSGEHLEAALQLAKSLEAL